jgi:hypothetical protein
MPCQFSRACPPDPGNRTQAPQEQVNQIHIATISIFMDIY